MHYAHGVVIDKDYDKDMKLPFKVDEKCASCDIIIISPNSLSIELPKPYFIASTTFIQQDEMFIPSSFLSNIWQPPKTC